MAEKFTAKVKSVDRYFLAFVLILGISTYLRFRHAFFDGMWVDEGRYGRIALDLARHPLEYSTAEAWKGKISGIPPVFPYLLAFATWIIPDNEIAIRSVSPLVSVAGVAVTYFFGREIRDEETGLLAAGFLAIAPTFWVLSERILIGATLTTVYTATLFALYYGLEDRKYSKYSLYALGPLTAISLMTMQRAYSLGPVMLFYVIYKKRDALRELYSDFDPELLKTEFRGIGLAAVIGALTLLPWSLRNLTTCGFPLCGLQRALTFTAQSGTKNEAVFNVVGNFYFITNLPVVIGQAIAVLAGARILYYLLNRLEEMEYLAKALGFTAAVSIGAYLLVPKLTVMAVLASIALFPERDEEKLIWLWIGFGIGLVSLPAIKVPRYIVFTIPAFTLLAAFTVMDLSDWISDILGTGSIEIRGVPLFSTRWAAIAALTVFVLAFTFPIASKQVSRQTSNSVGSAAIKPAGEWIDDNTPESAELIASSNRQIMFYAYPRVARFPSDNKTEFIETLRTENITHVVVDTYEKAQPKWMQYEIPPWRIPNSVRRKISRARQTGGRAQLQAIARQTMPKYRPAPDYLVSVKSFGKTRKPFRRSPQPQVIVYRVNRSALPSP